MNKPTFQLVNIFSSTDYDLFKTFDFNRDIDKAHVNKLKESMTKRGFISTLIVVLTDIFDDDGNKYYYLLDGQHRFTAAKELGLPIEFRVVEVDSEMELAEFIADVNNSSKGWGTNQFIHIWSTLKIAEYVKFKTIMEETDMQITPLVIAYTGQGKMDDFRKGKMRFPNEAASDVLIEQIMDLKQYLPSKAFCRRAIINVMRDPQYNHEAIKPYIIRQSVTRSFTENEKELLLELKNCLKYSLKTLPTKSLTLNK
jgi:hypothetical protein